MSQLLDYLLARQEAMTHTLEQWVMLESPSNEHEAVNALGDLVARAFKGNRSRGGSPAAGCIWRAFAHFLGPG